MTTPRHRKWRESDLDQKGQAGMLDSKKVTEALNDLSQDVTHLLSQNLTFEDNFRAQFVPLEVVTGNNPDDAFPIAVKLKERMPADPLCVLVAWARNVSNPRMQWTAAVQAFWEPGAPGQIRITYISGLSANTRYRIQLVVLGG